MNFFERNKGPLLHSLSTLPSMVYEFTCIPSHIRRQNRDWQLLVERVPELRDFPRHRKGIKESLAFSYGDYVNNYSANLISASLNLATFLYYLSCSDVLKKADGILDLGSGYSSYVFRQAAGNKNIYSVDDSADWLEETREFLDKHNASATGLLTLDEFNKTREDLHYQMCFVDIGDFDLRLSLMDFLCRHALSNGSMIIVDDFHVPAYRRKIIGLCDELGLSVYSLRKFTRARLSHAALILPADRV